MFRLATSEDQPTAPAQKDREVEAVARTVGSSSRIPELDGLRGLAILSVIFFHYTAGEGFIAPGTFASHLQRILFMGWSGVDLFFVLSGFLIGGILLDVRHSKSYFRTFYLRRFFRIIPIYYLWITAYIVVVLVAGHWLKLHSFSNRAPAIDFGVLSHYLFLQNIVPLAMPGFTDAWFGALWSLAIEEQFYLFAPLVIRYVTPRRLTACFVAIICAAPVLRIVVRASWPSNPLAASFLMPCRADSLAVGMLLALAWRSPAAREWFTAHTRALYAALGVLFVGMAALWKWSPSSIQFPTQTVGFTWIALFYGTLLVISLSHREGLIARVMRIGWLREVGKVSYCMYIVHLMVALACHALILHQMPRTSSPKAFVVSVLAVLITYGVAKISWLILEQPLLRRGHQFKY